MITGSRVTRSLLGASTPTDLQVIGSDLQKLAYPEDYNRHVNNQSELKETYGHAGSEVLDVQARGEISTMGPRGDEVSGLDPNKMAILKGSNTKPKTFAVFPLRHRPWRRRMPSMLLTRAMATIRFPTVCTPLQPLPRPQDCRSGSSIPPLVNGTPAYVVLRVGIAARRSLHGGKLWGGNNPASGLPWSRMELMVYVTSPALPTAMALLTIYAIPSTVSGNGVLGATLAEWLSPIN